MFQEECDMNASSPYDWKLSSDDLNKYTTPQKKQIAPIKTSNLHSNRITSNINTPKKMYSPPPQISIMNSNKVIDRFISLSDKDDLFNKFTITNPFSFYSHSNSSKQHLETQYTRLLKANIFYSENAETRSINKVNKYFNLPKKTAIKSKLFTYNKPHSTLTDKYNINTMEEQEMSRGYSHYKINPKPYKVIHTQNLLDDFYLNLVDWSNTNHIAVAKANKIALLSSNNTNETILSEYFPSTKYVSSLIFSDNGTDIAVGTSEGEVELYDIETKKLIHLFPGHSSRVGVVSFNRNILSSGSKDTCIINRDIRVNSWKTKSSEISRYFGHQQEICGWKWNGDGTQWASGGNDNRLFLWSVHKNRPLMCSTEHSAAVKAIAWSPHQRHLLLSGGGTADRCIRFWNTATLTQLNKVDTGSQVCNLVFSKTKNELVSTHGFSLNQIIVWNAKKMEKLATLTGHTYRVLYLGISPNGESIVTGAGDQTLRFWRVFRQNEVMANNKECGLFPLNTDIR